MTASETAVSVPADAATVRHQRFRQGVRATLAVVLLLCALLYVLWTWRWPLVGDSSLFHYIAFLMDHGMAPYRDIPDMNMPGAFLVEWLVMHTYGGGSLAWRLFDLTALLAMGAGLLILAWPYDAFAGLFSAVLFALLHGRDGIYDTGQRDLTMAALVVLGYVFLFQARRRQSPWAAALFGFCMATAGTLKPTPLPLMLLLLLWLLCALRKEGRPIGAMLAAGLFGMLLPLAGVTLWLLRERALGAFVHSLLTVDPYFAGLGRRPLGFLLVHSISPIMLLAALWLVLLIASAAAGRSSPWSGLSDVGRWERGALALGALLSLAGYIAQGKAFPYQRYGFLVLLLLLIALDLTAALRQRGWRLFVAVAALSFACLFLAPRSLAKVRQYDWRNQEFTALMDADLLRLGGSRLSGHIQCMDTVSGCSLALYKLRLISETGLLSDFLVFGPADNPEIRAERAEFLPQVEARPPWVIVVTGSLFPQGPAGFQKLKLWPQFHDFLSAHYQLCVQRQPAKPANWGGTPPEIPAPYRIYVLAGSPQAAGCSP